MSKKYGFLTFLCICAFVCLNIPGKAQTNNNRQKNTRDTKAITADWAKSAQSADVIRIINRANSAVKGFGLGGKKIKLKKQKQLLKKYIRQLSQKRPEILKNTSARRELFNLSIQDSILGLLLSIKREDELTKIVKSEEFKKVSKIIGLSS